MKQLIIITGMSKTGKSTLLHDLMSHFNIKTTDPYSVDKELAYDGEVVRMKIKKQGVIETAEDLIFSHLKLSMDVNDGVNLIMVDHEFGKNYEEQFFELLETHPDYHVKVIRMNCPTAVVFDRVARKVNSPVLNPHDLNEVAESILEIEDTEYGKSLLVYERFLDRVDSVKQFSIGDAPVLELDGEYFNNNIEQVVNFINSPTA